MNAAYSGPLWSRCASTGVTPDSVSAQKCTAARSSRSTNITWNARAGASSASGMARQPAYSGRPGSGAAAITFSPSSASRSSPATPARCLRPKSAH